MDNKNIENTPTVRKTLRPLWLEILLAGLIIVLISFVAFLFLYTGWIRIDTEDLFSLTYSEGKEIKAPKGYLTIALIAGVIDIFFALLCFFAFRPSGLKQNFGKKGKYLWCLLILSLFGYLAYFVISFLLYGWIPKHPGIDLLLTGMAVNLYEYLIYKLYMEERTLSNALFWEIFRFCIVGLVAAVFDFLTCFIFQFLIFKGNTAWYVTLVSTAMGFVIGVIINYLMSTYMVYKASHSGMAKTAKGIVLFVALSALGLLIGMGIQYLLYDILFVKVGVSFFSYPIDFVIRTLIVMVYNYLTRKLIIYRK